MNSSYTEITRTLIEHLESTISALTGASARSASAPATPPTDGWLARFVAGDDRCTWDVAFDGDGAAALTGLILGGDEAPPSEAITDALSELCAQVAGAITLLPIADGRKWQMRELRQGGGGDAPPDAAFVLTVDSLPVPLRIAVTAPPHSASPLPATVPDRPSPPNSERDHLDRILDIELPVIVRFGRSELPLRTLARLGPGSLIDLGRSPDDPVELLVSNRVIAHGEVVVVAGSYGIRILDVVNPNERARSLES